MRNDVTGIETVIMFLLIVAALFLYNWISSWQIFQERVTSTFETYEFSGEVIVQYQVSGTQSLATYTVPVYKEVITHTAWYGKELYTQCVIRTMDQVVPGNVGHIATTAENILAANGIPLGYEMVDFRRFDGDGIDCSESGSKEDVYIRLSGNFDREGDYVLLSKRSGNEYEWAWVKFPASLFDQVLMSAVNSTSFSLDTYSPTQPEVVASYVVKSGDPNGLVNWINGYHTLLSAVYKQSPEHISSPGTADVTSSRTVVTGWHKEVKCNYKGVCSSKKVNDTSTLTETNTYDTTTGSFVLNP